MKDTLQTINKEIHTYEVLSQYMPRAQKELERLYTIRDNYIRKESSNGSKETVSSL